MTNYRNPKLVERYEDVVFELDTPLVSNTDATIVQKKDGYKFYVNNSGEETPFDWYNARFNVNFKLLKLAGNNAVVAAADRNGIVNSASSLIKKIIVKMNGINVYECSDANQVTNIKNLLEYSTGYSKSQGTNEFFFLDTTRSAENRTADAQAATFNKGFAERKLLLNAGGMVYSEIPLNRYGFFEALHDELIPNSQIEFNIDLESDDDLVWQASNNCRVILFKFQLIVPRITFNSEGKKLYFNTYLEKRSWTYLHETIQSSDSTQQRSGTYRITTAVNKPRHVFVFILNDARLSSQTENKFIYDTFNVADDKSLTSCHLELGNGKDYPEVHYTPSTEPTRVFRDVLKYAHANNDYAGDTLLNRSNYETIFPMIHFDLTKQPTDIKDGMTRLTFKYTLDDSTNAGYKIYALVMNEQEVEVRKTDGRLVLRSM